MSAFEGCFQQLGLDSSHNKCHISDWFNEIMKNIIQKEGQIFYPDIYLYFNGHSK